MTRQLWMLLPIILLLSSAVLISPLPAIAHLTTSANPSPGGASATASPDSAPLGGPVSLTVCAGSTPITFALGAGIFAPGGLFFPAVDASHPTSLAADTCHTWVAPDDFPGLPLAPGSHTFVLDTTATTLLIEFGVTFFVLPESSIGAIAIIGSAFAALGAFVGFRRHGLKS